MTEELQRNELICIIRRAQSGNEESFRILRERYTPLIDGCVHRHILSDMQSQDIEDLCAEALVNFCNAVCSYDCGSDGVEFGLYAKICIDNGLVSFVRSYSRRSKNKVVPLDWQRIERSDSVSRDFLDTFVDRENASALVDQIKCNLSDYENRVWWLYVSGMSISDIAEKIGDRDARSVSNAVYRIRKKLRSCLQEHK